MIWHFGELGMENSLFTCSDGSVNTSNDTTQGDCKLDTKPQPQWVNNWPEDQSRSNIYDTWSRLIELKTNEPVFKGNYDIFQPNNINLKTIYIWDDALPANELKNVNIIANFETQNVNMSPNFPYGGIWYDLMDPTGNTFINVDSSFLNPPINLEPGEFRVFGNTPSESLSLNNQEFDKISIYPNPTKDKLFIKSQKSIKSIHLLSVLGQVVETIKPNSFDIILNLSNLRSGNYFIKISTDDSLETYQILKE